MGQRIGQAAETRVEGAFAFHDLPKWFRGIRRATQQEDSQGIDFVIFIDTGDILLQVKSSQREKDRFLEVQAHRSIPVVVIDLSESDRKIRRKVISAIVSVRKKLLASQKEQKDMQPPRRT